MRTRKGPCRLKSWSSHLDLTQNNKTKVRYHSWATLSTLVSFIGKPFYIDNFTASQEMSSYARIRIQIDRSYNFPKVISFTNE